MPSHNEQVQPAAFDLADPTPTPAQTGSAAGGQAPERARWIVPALIGLGVLAMLVVFWLPGRITPSATPPAEVPATTGEAKAQSPTKTAGPSEEASPWSDAQLAKLRKEAQDALGNLLEVQDLLENTGVMLWAGEQFEQAKTLAGEGDAHYRERRFVEATASYEAGLAAMNTILESTDDALAAQLEEARLAIEAGDKETALEHLDVASAIEPGSEELAALTQRVAALEQLLPLLTQAEEAEKIGDLASAESLLGEAAAIDPQHRRVSAELARVTTAHTAMRFGDAMSEGYIALDESRFSAARSAFNKAASLSPGSGEAASALEEVQVAETAYKLSRLNTQGSEAEKSERWKEAVQAYEQALEIDSNMLYAQEGIKRSRVREKLDQQFKSALEQPERLSDKTVAETTTTLIRQAKNISPRGPVLGEQIDRLEILLEQANSLLSLTLRSDGETNVTVYKVARLGKFEQRELTLRPGQYTAVGTRNGFRDVRVTFKVSHEKPLNPVLISCTEAI